jgi:hypothetical protein
MPLEEWNGLSGLGWQPPTQHLLHFALRMIPRFQKALVHALHCLIGKWLIGEKDYLELVRVREPCFRDLLE